MRKINQSGFNILELIIVLSIMAILTLVIYVSTGQSRQGAYQVLTQAQIKQMENALEFYLDENDGTYPEDEDRNLPSEFVTYLGPGEWPDGPWPGSVYDWENWEAGDLNGYAPLEEAISD